MARYRWLVVVGLLEVLVQGGCSGGGWETLVNTIPAGDVYAGAPAVVLEHHHQVWFEPPATPGGWPRGISRVWGAVKIQNAEGLKYAHVYASYVDSLERLRSFEARVVSADGSVRTVQDKDIQTVNSSSLTRSISDSRTVVASPPDVRSGDVLQFRYVVECQDGRLQRSWSPYLRAELPVRRASYAVKKQPGIEVRPRAFRDGQVVIGDPAVHPPGGEPWARFELSDLPAREGEPFAPSLQRVMPRFDALLVRYQPPGGGPALEGLTSWQRFAEWYRGLLGGAFDRTGTIQAIEKEIYRGVPADPVERVRQAYRFVQGRIRYVAIELGIGGWKPRTAVSTLANRYGDCKDKATLLVTLARGQGLKANVVLVGTRGKTLAVREEPGTWQFNHAIAAIDLPTGRVYLDPTAHVGEFKQLVEDDQGAAALVVTEQGFEQVTLPISGPDDNRIEATYDLSLDNRGNASGDAASTVTGWPARRLRSGLLFYAPAERSQVLGSVLGEWARKGRLRADQVKNYDVPLRVQGTFTHDHFASRSADHLLFHPDRIVPVQIPELQHGARQLPLVFEPPLTVKARVVVTAPAGYLPGDLPANVDVERPAGRFTITYRRLDARRVAIDVLLRRVVHEAPPGAYAELRELFRSSRAALGRVVPFRRQGQGG
jgi:hypothetical protein